MRLTGERPMEGSTPDSLLALHDAGYREVRARLGPGVVLDVGCGVGDETARLAAGDRLVVGVDYEPAATVHASAAWGRRGIRGDRARFAGMDGTRLGIRSASVDWACSSHIIEHFNAPEAHVAELARVLRPAGTAFVITPNAPADFENPFHVYLFDPPQLVSLLRLFFADVAILGLEGDEALKTDFATRRAAGQRILRLDFLRLRRRIPRPWYVWTYERALPIAYRILGDGAVHSGLDHTHLFITERIDSTTPVLFAIARSPRRPVSRG